MKLKALLCNKQDTGMVGEIGDVPTKAKSGGDTKDSFISLKITDLKVTFGQQDLEESTRTKNGIYLKLSSYTNENKLWKSKSLKPKEILEWSKLVNLHVHVEDKITFTIKQNHPTLKPFKHNHVLKKDDLAIMDILHKFVDFQRTAQDIEIAGGTIHVTLLKETLPKDLIDFEPTKAVLAKWSGCTQTINDFLEATKDKAGITETADNIANILGSLHQKLQDQESCHKQILQLLLAMSDVASGGEKAYQVDQYSTALESALREVAALIAGSLGLAFKISQTSMMDQIFLKNGSEEIEGFKKEYEVLMSQYREMLITLKRFYTITSDEEQHLRSILTPLDGCLASQCLPGTREQLLNGIISHILQRETQAVWIQGIAGAGKSCIAGTLKDLISTNTADNIVLGGSYQCLKGSRSDDSSRLLPSLSFQMACSVPAYGKRLIQSLQQTSSSNLSRSLKMQYELLLQKPLLLLKKEGKSSVSRVVLIIDGLDEWGSSQDRIEFLSFMQYCTSQTEWLCLVIASRPDPHPEELIAKWSHAIPVNLSLAEDVKSDLTRFLEDGFSKFTLDITPTEISDLADFAGSSFIWARTLLRFVEGDGDQKQRRQRLRTWLGMKSAFSGVQSGEYGALYALYNMILEKKVSSTPQSLGHFCKVVGTVLVLHDGLSTETLCKLLEFHQVPSQITLDFLYKLQAIIYPTQSGTISFHLSFAEYLHTRQRAGVYHLDLSECHYHLAQLCLSIMEKHLSFNMCGIESSYFSNKDSIMGEQVEQVLPPHVQYACSYWAAHSAQSAGSKDVSSLHERILQFVESSRVVYWIEAASLMGKVYIVGESIKILKSCLQDASGHLLKCLEELHRFIDAFSIPISESAPHLYVSALPMTPHNTWLSQNFTKNIGQVIRIAETPKAWPVLIQRLTEDAGVECVAYSADGRYIVTGLTNNTIRQWNIETGEAFGIGMIGHRGQVNTLTYSPDGRHIISGSDDFTVCIWNTESGSREKELIGHTGGVLSVACSLDGMHIVSGSNDWTIRVWNTSSAAEEFQISHGSHMAYSVAYSPDGKHIACGSTDHAVRIWNTETREEIQLIGHEFLVNSIAYSPDGRFVVSGSADETVRIWDAYSGKEEKKLIGHTDWVNSVSFSPDGAHIVSGSDDKTTRIWSVESGEEELKFTGHRFRVTSVAYSRDGGRVVSGSDDRTVRIWSTLSGRQETQPTDWVNSVVYSPDGKYIVSGSSDSTVKVLMAESGEQKMQFTGHTFWVNCVAFAPDKRCVASGSGAPDNSIRIWSMDSERQLMVLKGHTNGVSCVVYSPDGKNIASGSFDHTIGIWRVKSGQQEMLLKGHKALVTSVAYSPDGRSLVSGSSDGAIMIWNTEYGHQEVQLKGHAGGVTSVAYSPDGELVVSGSQDQTVRIWNVDSRQEVMHLKGHTQEVTSVAYSPDGKYVVSGSDDKTIRVWSTMSGNEGMRLVGHTGGVKSVAYSLDGKSIVSGSFDGTVRTWAAEPPSTRNSSNSRDMVAYHASLINQWRMNTPEMNSASGHGQDSSNWLTSKKDGHKVLWLPEHLHAGFKSPQIMTVPSNAPNHAVHVDSTSFKHGKEWALAWIPNN